MGKREMDDRSDVLGKIEIDGRSGSWQKERWMTGVELGKKEIDGRSGSCKKRWMAVGLY